MAWDITAPADSDNASDGDNSIRTLKTDIQTALRANAASGTEAVFPGSDVANPVFRYRGLKGTTAARPASGQYGLYSNTTLNTLQRDNGSSWDDIATLVPSGTVMVFLQAAAPTGWTKSTAHNDKALRVVSGAGGGNGGTTDFTSCWASAISGSGGGHTPTTLSVGTATTTAGSGSDIVNHASASHIHTITINAVAAHTHGVTSYVPQYVDSIICVKD